jgi:hypothetical protein
MANNKSTLMNNCKLIVPILLVVLCGSCYYYPTHQHISLHQGPSIIYADHGATLEVSEGFVCAAYSRWRKYLAVSEADERLSMLCVETRPDGKWIIKASRLWTE